MLAYNSNIPNALKRPFRKFCLSLSAENPLDRATPLTPARQRSSPPFGIYHTRGQKEPKSKRPWVFLTSISGPWVWITVSYATLTGAYRSSSSATAAWGPSQAGRAHLLGLPHKDVVQIGCPALCRLPTTCIHRTTKRATNSSFAGDVKTLRPLGVPKNFCMAPPETSHRQFSEKKPL